MLDDRDHRPSGPLSGWRSQSVGQKDATNEELAALLELERGHPERVAALAGVIAVLLVAALAFLLAWAVLG